MSITKIVLVLALIVACASAFELTAANFDEATSGKSVFIKFFAPWCGHCKKMAPAWQQLMDEFAGSETALVGEVDCPEHSDLCQQYGVRGYPTIKYGDVNNMEPYNGGRDFDTMLEFAKENLGPTCGPANLDLCDEDQTAEIQKYQAMDAAELQTSIDDKEAALEKAETDFKAAVEGLQSQYEQLTKDKEATIAEVKSSGLGVMKMVAASNKATTESHDEL